MTDNTDTITDTPTPPTRGGYRAGAGRPAGAKDKTPRTRATKADGKTAWTVQVRVDANLEQAIKTTAAERGVSPATLARDILEQALLGEED